MKIMSYNLLFGGFDGEDGARHQEQIALINSIQPDILLVQEAKNFDAFGFRLLYETEKQLGMRGFLALSQRGQPTGVFIRPPITPVTFEADSINFHHAKAVLKLQVPTLSKQLTVISTHLCPYGPELRVCEAYYLVKHCRPKNYVLLAGDLNSISPYDNPPYGLADLPAFFRVRHLAQDGVSMDSRPLSLLYQAGYIDIAYEMNKHMELTVPASGFKGTEFVPSRFDYMLATEKLAERLVDYAVIKNGISDMASDHYPVVAEFS